MIELKGIRRSFGSHEVLRQCDLQLTAGSSVAIIGQSGSGKTTLGRILLRLLEPSSGSYTFNGLNVLALKGRDLQLWRHNVQAVFQNPWDALNPRLRVAQLVTEPLYVTTGLRGRKARRKAEELLDEVGLPSSFVDHYPRQLSGGQRQRVAIARALSVHPRLLILDEPVSSLDVSLRSQILLLVKNLVAKYDTAVVYITHDIVTIPYLCSRAYVLYNGMIMEELSANQLVSGPDNPYTQTLRDAVLTLGSPMASPSPPSDRMSVSGHAECTFARNCAFTMTQCIDIAPTLNTISQAEGWRSRCHFAGKPKIVSDA
jgi:ABC-type glutathione transport system ATPase component